MRPFWWVFIGALLACLLLAIIACNGSTQPGTPPAPEVPTASKTETPPPLHSTSSPPPAPELPAASGTPTPVPPSSTPSPPPPTSTPTSTPEPSWAPEGLQQPDDLDSYRSRLEVSWVGTASNGEEATGSMELVIESVRDPLMHHVSIAGDYPQSKGMNIPPGQTLHLYLVDGALYTNLLGRWQRRYVQDDALNEFVEMPLVVSDELLRGIGQATYLGHESFNGMDTLHFGLDETSFQSAEPDGAVIEDGSGEVYVALEDYYLVFMKVSLAGTNLALPTDTNGRVLTDGTVEVTFDLSSVNEAFEIQVPEEALLTDPVPAASPVPVLLTDVLVPDHAEDLTSSPLGLLSYRSPRTWEALAVFYRDGMPRLGWHETQADLAGEVTSLTYTKDRRTATITLAPDKSTGSTAVWIVVSSE